MLFYQRVIFFRWVGEKPPTRYGMPVFVFRFLFVKFPKVLNTAGIPKVHAAEIKVSNAKNHGCSGYIGDDSYPVIIIS